MDQDMQFHVKNPSKKKHQKNDGMNNRTRTMETNSY